MSLESDQRVDRKTARKTLNTYFALIAQDWQARQVEAMWPLIEAQLTVLHGQGKTLNVRQFMDRILLKHDLPELPVDLSQAAA